MTAAGLTFSADAIAQAEVTFANNELQITAPKQFQLDLGREEIQTAPEAAWPSRPSLQSNLRRDQSRSGAWSNPMRPNPKRRKMK